MDDFRELDTVLSGPIFHNLTHVIVRVLIYSDRSAVQDEDSAHGLTLCLPMLDARGILGVFRNNIRLGMHWDKVIGDWICDGAGSITAQDAVMTNAGASADDDRRTNNTATVTNPHDASDVVSAISQPVWVPSATYADAQLPSSSKSTDARVPAEPACDDKPVPQNATAGSVESPGDSTPHDHGVAGKSSAGPGLRVYGQRSLSGGI